MQQIINLMSKFGIKSSRLLLQNYGNPNYQQVMFTNLLTKVFKLGKSAEEYGGNTETQEKHVEEEGHVHVDQLGRGRRGSARMTREETLTGRGQEVKN